MELSSFLKSEAVRVLGQVSSKKRLFQELAQLITSCCGVNANDVFDALQERESLGPTGVGHGVALPHARLPDLDGIKGAFLKLERPLDFGSVDRQPIDLVFALFAPEDTGVDHLKALALVSRTMRDKDIRAKLRANDDPVALHAILTEARTSQAA